MSKNISVKVKVSSLITALKKALADRHERLAESTKAEADYNKAYDKWKVDFQKAVVSAVKNGKAKAEGASPVRYCHGHTTPDTHQLVELTLTIPKSLLVDEPKYPELYREHEYKVDRAALENAIRVLEMSDSETVSTGTYHSVVKYL